MAGHEAALRDQGGSSLGEDGERDIICFSHLRWDFVYQRPQQLLGRAARSRRVFFVEEPMYNEAGLGVRVTQSTEGVWIILPFVSDDYTAEQRAAFLRGVIDKLILEHNINEYVAWYYTPYWLRHTSHLRPAVTVYDCMDELTLFKNANPVLLEWEPELLRRANLVFTGGQSLYEAKRDRHPNVLAFPSSIDRQHFRQARAVMPDPDDQRHIPHPRLGFFGVIDERIDLPLIAGVADARPQWQIVLVGPVVKIDEKALPRRSNLHYVGMKTYDELPRYLAGWDVAVMPFARNDATRFISPTKTPEYLAGGKPVVSTTIRDVVRPYGEMGLVSIADRPLDFVAAVEAVLGEDAETRHAWLERVDAFLQQNSWDLTWERMDAMIEAAVASSIVSGQ